MYKQLTLFVFSLMLVGTHQKKLKIQLFYESMCSDSQNFINSYFTSRIQSLLKYADVEYIPYGKASHRLNRYGDYEFTCQHGPIECYGNKVQACVASQNADTLKVSRFVDCAMSSMYDRQEYGLQLSHCADRCGLNWDAIEECANSDFGNRLLAHYGEITHNFDGRLKFVPTVMVNSRRIIVESYDDFENFFTEICSLLQNKPNGCHQTSRYYY